ncbi:EVE domain-containing protein [Saccharibacillus sacchari]|uniref:EVE domain-containing protein n=1 Tax=Saccharibacillus sacchari TaxID=456493 RepID=UPI0004B44EBC|nr:EVE domain-containing protein [Saccharibacillus sacchari]
MLPGLRYWVGVVSASHVDHAIEQGIAQTCHGKAHALNRMQPGDWLIYYSPRTDMNGGAPLQAFTAIGQVADDRVYRHKVSDAFIPYRRDMQYLPAKPVRIAGLLEQLSFTKGRRSWGQAFRFGQFEITPEDFRLIADLMLEDADEQEIKPEAPLRESQLEFEW